MKFFMALSVLLSANIAFADQVIEVYSNPHEMMNTLITEEECKENGEEWLDELGCIQKVEDTVTIETNRVGRKVTRKVSIAVIGETNGANYCELDSTDVEANRGASVLKAKAQGEEGECSVTINVNKKERTLSVQESGSCAGICYGTASLNIEKASLKETTKP